MFRLLIDAMLVDTFILFVFAFLVGLPIREQRRGLYVLDTERRWLFVLFPWLFLVRWIERPARRLYRHRRLSAATFLFVIFGMFALLVWGIWNDIPVLSDGSSLVILWIVFLDLWLSTDGPDRGKGGRRDDDPAPTTPTPTGEAADRWVRGQQSQTDQSSPLVSTHL